MTERERLIELIGNKPFTSEYEKYNCVEWVEKFADYLLANGVIVPPCKVGDTLYDISEFTEGIPCPEMYELNADYISIKKDEKGKCYFEYDCIDIYPEDIGKRIFLTAEEAEAKLKGGAE